MLTNSITSLSVQILQHVTGSLFFLPSNKGYSLFPLSPQTEKAPCQLTGGPAGKVLEMHLSYTYVRFLPSLITLQTAWGFGMLGEVRLNVCKFQLHSSTPRKKEIKFLIQQRPLLIFVKHSRILKSSFLLAITIGE